VASNLARDGGASRVTVLSHLGQGWSTLLEQEGVIRHVGSSSGGAQILQEFRVGWDMSNCCQEGDVDVYILEDLPNLLINIRLIPDEESF